MNGREIRKALRGGGRVYSSAVTAVSSVWPKLMAAAGVDFAFIDSEHTSLNRESVGWLCKAFLAEGLPSVVRIPTRNPDEAAQVLDGGACGFIVPCLETIDQVRQFEAVARYRPLKGRRAAEAVTHPADLEAELSQYLAERNQDTLFIANIESVPAMENLDELLSVGAIDSVLIGPHDLSCSLGIPEQYDHPRFDEAVRKIIGQARSHGVGAGIHYFWSIDQEVDWSRTAGANLIMHSADLVIYGNHLKQEIERLRRELGDDCDHQNLKSPIV